MRLLLAALLLGPSFCFGAALPSEFEGSRVNSSGLVYLKGAGGYKNLSAAAQAAAVSKGAAALGRQDCQIAVELDGAGELWDVRNGKAAQLDAWSDRSMPLAHGSSRIGRWFASFGMQAMNGGDFPSGAMNLRLGSTLFKNRYDLALAYDYSKPRDSIVSRTSLGLVGRALLPLSPHGGWNIGGQISSADNYGDQTSSIGLVTGLNVYLPGGSFDITFKLQDKGAYGLMAGYTVFLSR
jgi:hypothetical protein